MRKFFIAVSVAFAAVMSMNAQTGAWTGKLKVSGVELVLIFNIGEESATLDVPDQGAKEIPVEVSRDAVGGITLSVPAINASFKGLWAGKMIVGTFTQHGMSFPMTLTPGVQVMNRPQTPVGPFPYATEEVSFTNGDAVLKGTLTLPENCDRNTPVLVMVTGSGLQNRDEEAFGHKPFAVIADAFAKAGIATLRYDDRGFGESTGDVVFCTTEDLKNDALSGVKLLRERFDIVGVIGHSEGGTIALMLASEKQVDFAISLAGMIVSGAETLLDQNRQACQAAGLPDSEVDAYCRLLSDTFDAVKTKSPLPSVDNYDLSDALRQNYAQVLNQFQSPYMKYFIGLDLSGSLAGITCPVMALNGTKDTQVQCERNLDVLKSGLSSGGKNLIKAEVGLNHLFQHCATGAFSEYKEIEETISPEVLSEMIAWIKAL
ncbi:MAG TPA: alpha/beta hydrolase [Rikenellaceae bacterium]|nr:alpha/beta hydrolase [Rikenellaceae bacterium]HCQ71825.1 alpha/beta hydrolase [Rikenellaceae bacterium]